MPAYSRRSKSRRDTCHPDLILILDKVIEIYDVTILEGFRTPANHARYLREKRTKVPYHKSKHSRNPSEAVDLSPWPIPEDWGSVDWKERAKFYQLAGIMKGIAHENGIRLRWGGDWDGDHDFRDQSFDDLVHFELIL